MKILQVQNIVSEDSETARTNFLHLYESFVWTVRGDYMVCTNNVNTNKTLNDSYRLNWWNVHSYASTVIVTFGCVCLLRRSFSVVMKQCKVTLLLRPVIYKKYANERHTELLPTAYIHDNFCSPWNFDHKNY